MRGASFSVIVCFLVFSMILTGCPKNGSSDVVEPTGGGMSAAAEAKKASSRPVEPLEVVPWVGEFADGWKEYDKLSNEQKYEAAAKVVDRLLEKAKREKKSEEWVRGLIRKVMLRTSLHGYETSVRFLAEQEWPQDLLGNTVLNLYYANSLVTYAHRYSWEIRKREKVDSKGRVDLKAWTMEQIFTAAQKSYQKVFSHRKQLGDHPIKHLADYIDQNDYPEQIRPTLRDAVSYLRVQLLSDTSGWRPEHTNQIYQLNLKALLGKQKLSPGASIDPAVHPLIKICAILDDLERWHASRDEPAAAFEARLSRLRILHQNITGAPDRLAIKQDLKKHLEPMRKLPWWAVGQALYAELTRAEDTPDNLIRARKLAIEGEKAYPESIGGQRCNHIVRSIESPDYNLEAMATDAPSRESIAVNYKNLTEIYFRAYPIDLKKHIEASNDYNLLPNHRELNRLIKKSKPAHKWKVEPASTPDYKMHRHFVVPPIEKVGFYVVMASAYQDFRQSTNKILGVNTVVGDLVMVTQQEGGQVKVTVLSGKTGRPVSGVRVYLYKYDWNTKHKSVATRRTGKDGTISFARSDSRSYFLYAQKGRQVAIDPNHIRLYPQQKPQEHSATLIYTDRSIYRPLQKILFKTVVYRGCHDLGNYQTAPNTKVTVTLMDANYQKVESQTLKTNSYGTASGEFAIPTGRLLGNWRLQTSPNGNAYFKVEEYKRPTFEVKLLDPKDPLRLNKTARLKGEARYYFGLPLVTAKVKWRVVRSPVYPWWWGWYYWRGQQGGRSQTVATGVSELKEDGTFEVKFTPKADERLAETSRDLSYRYSVSVDVTDEGGETRSASRGFRLGFVAVEARVDMQTNFFLENRKSELTVRRTNLDGNPAPGKGQYRIVAVKTPPKTLLPVDQPLPLPPGMKADLGFMTAGDRQRTRWDPRYNPEAVMREWADGTEQTRGDLKHDDKGEAKVEVPALPAGAYRIHYSTVDAYGAKYEMKQEFLVAGKNTKIPLPALLRVEKSSVKVGGTARVFALSGLDNQTIIYDIHKDGKRIKRRQLEAGKDPTLIEIPITEKDRGGFGVTVWVLRDHQFMSYQKTIFVPWDNQELKLEFSTFRDKLRPGQKEKWIIKVTGPAGKDTTVAAAELLAYMYDRSLDAFAPHSHPSPLSLFPNHSGIAWARAGLGRARIVWADCHGWAGLPGYPALHGDSLRFHDEYGVGGPGRRGHRQYRSSLAASRAPAVFGMKKDAEERVALRKESKSEVAQPVEANGRDDIDMVAFGGLDEGGRLLGHPKAGGKGEEGRPPEPVQVRTDFSETAFFQPHLLTNPDGSASIEFQIPDSVTSWNVYVHAITKDLKSGTVKKEAKSVKDLMVRPYLPRFLREGDLATIKVVVNNASEGELKGRVDFDIIDPATEKSLLADFGLSKKKAFKQPFTVKAGGGTNLSFPIKTPAKIGLIAFRVIARSGDISDGELRPIPVLPGRMHLIQSRFVTLRDQERRVMVFEDMKKDDDPTRIHNQMVVTIDAQLFYSVLSALPYLVNYPYECTEQLLNRFLSTGILSSLYGQYPSIKRMAKEFSKRKTEWETWSADDPNRKMALEETPWVQEAQGGPARKNPLINVLDPRITKAHREASLAKLKKAQTSSGAFPWFPGGPPSPYMTLYLLHGFSKALEFGVDVPKDTIRRAWGYMHRHYSTEMVQHMLALDCCWEFITFLNYTLGNYPDLSWTGGVFTDKERTTMLDFSFRHWKQHSPYMKGYLSLTLFRMDRKKDAKLVWESVMDSAKEEKDQGTHWAPEDRAWLWYNDTIETHAFAIRTIMEIMPKEPKLDGLVLWLFLNKKMNHWKSTKATSEVIYSLAHYLKKTEQLATREEITVTVGDLKKHFVFLPDKYTGKKNQIVIPGEQVDPKKTSTVVVEKKTKGFAMASATWHFSTERLPKEARGDYLKVTRKFSKRVKTGREVVLKPLKEGAQIEPGDEVEVHLSISSKHPMEYVHLRDPRPAGFEPVGTTSKHKWNLGIYWYEEVRDSGMNFFFEALPQGEFPFKHRMRATMAGKFKVAPATLQPMYAPEFAAYSSGKVITIKPTK
jgi:uncharacterized protein YfaS (alpha-2-macroglobulin family)